MGVSGFISRICGSILMGIGLFLFVAMLLLVSFQAQVDDIDSLLDDTFTQFILEDEDAIWDTLRENPSTAEYVEQCDNGVFSGEDCVLDLDNPLVLENLETYKEEFKTQLVEGLEPVTKYVQYQKMANGVAFLLFVLGMLLVLLGVKFDWFKWAQKVSGKIGWYMLFAFLGVWYLLSLAREDYVNMISGLVEGAPDVLLLFVASLIEGMVAGTVGPLYMIFLVISAVGLGLWVLFLFLRGARKGKKILSNRKEKKAKKKSKKK
tara:strand:+ start:1880 stop:2668 length:789 start_codon:yes stop_codon:yes gene_type:complete